MKKTKGWVWCGCVVLAGWCAGETVFRRPLERVA